jgi:nucleotide-binding universal stress UspA family protein
MATVHEILIATDIERPARAALRYSFFLAEQFHASLHVVHAWTPWEVAPPNTEVPRQQKSERALSERRLRERLNAIVHEVPTAAPGCATTEIVDGPPAEAVLACSARQKSDLIVLGTAAESAPIFGTGEAIAQQISHHAWCPVITVPHRAGSSSRLQRIVLPLEERTSMARALEWAAIFARHFRAVVELFGPRTDSTSESHAALDHCRRHAEEALRVAGVAVEHHASDDVGRERWECVLGRLKKGDCDLVVMTAQSTTDGGRCSVVSVRRSSGVPVLSVRPDAPSGRFAARGLPTGRSSFSGGQHSTDASACVV